jgi:hypothetical protein
VSRAPRSGAGPRVAWGLALGVLLSTAGLAARQQAQTPPLPVPEAELVFEREVFRYPAFARRSPFKPLAGNEGGPRYEQMELRGIIYNPDAPRESVALLALRAPAEQQIQQVVQQQIQQQEAGLVAQQDTIYIPEPSQRLRVGQPWGNVRLVQIASDHVVLDVTEFGVTERRILRMPIRRQGGPS